MYRTINTQDVNCKLLSSVSEISVACVNIQENGLIFFMACHLKQYVICQLIIEYPRDVKNVINLEYQCTDLHLYTKSLSRILSAYAYEIWCIAIRSMKTVLVNFFLLSFLQGNKGTAVCTTQTVSTVRTGRLSNTVCVFVFLLFYTQCCLAQQLSFLSGFVRRGSKSSLPDEKSDKCGPEGGESSCIRMLSRWWTNSQYCH